RSGTSDTTQPASFSDLAAQGDAAGYNVLLVTLDTTRPDYLGCYGRENAGTPTIDALLEHGVRIDAAVTAVPTTLAAHSTILTGLEPYQHGVRNNGTYRLVERHTTLAESLKSNGYDTAAFVACFVLDRRFGLDQGFDVYDFSVSEKGRLGPQNLANERPASSVTNSFLDWWADRRRSGAQSPFFAWVHYYDPHAPHESPLQDTQRFRDLPYGAYASEVAFVDLHFRRILQAIDEQGQRERTLIVLASDHGESLSEHGEGGHGVFLYETTMWAALMFSCPSLFDGAYRIDDRVVGTVDIVPTVLDLLGLQPTFAPAGQSLLATQPDPARAIYMETVYPFETMGCSPLYGLRRLGDKYVHAPRAEYYDLVSDPGELSNRHSAGDSTVAELRAQLNRIIKSAAESGADAARTISTEEQARLESLGYAATQQRKPTDNLPDPKDQLPIIMRLKECARMRASGQLDSALECSQEVFEQTQCVDLAVFAVTDAHLALDQPRAALEVLRSYARSCQSIEVLIRLAEAQLSLQEYTEFLHTLEVAQAVDPLNGAVPVLRGNYLMEQRQYGAAAAAYQQALEIDGQRVNPDVRVRLEQARRLARGEES
ncbi:MAG: sulfatase, partial [bacterium]|nr:sulfatase [bacterium]